MILGGLFEFSVVILLKVDENNRCDRVLNVNKLILYYIVEKEVNIETIRKAAFLAGVLSTWREAFEGLAAPARLLITHEAEVAFQAQVRSESREFTPSDMVCAKRYASILSSMQPRVEMGSLLLEKMHRQIFDHPDGYRYFPGEFRTVEARKEFDETLNKILGLDEIDVFTKIHLASTAFLKLSPFRDGNHVMANVLLHALFVHFNLTPSPMLPLEKFASRDQGVSHEEFLQSILRAEERTESLYHAVRIIEARYRDNVASLETRPKKVALELLPYFMERETFRVREIETAYGKKFKITYHTLNKLMTRLVEDLHLLEIVDGGERNRVFALKGYQKLFA